MSTPNFITFTSDAFKLNSNGRTGHNLETIGLYVSGSTSLWDTTLPNAGPVMVIVESPTNWTTGCQITGVYKDATFVEWGTGLQLDHPYYYKIFTGSYTSGTFNLYVPTGSRAKTQYIITGATGVYGMKSLSITGGYSVTIYTLADNGARLAYGFNTEHERNQIDTLLRATTAGPVLCHTCTGTKYVGASYCPDCSGYGYYGFTSQDYTLQQQARRYGVFKRSGETEKSLQYRIWAKTRRVVPTLKEVKRFVSELYRLDEDVITISEEYYPEAVWTIRLPLNVTSGIGIGDILSTETKDIIDILRDICPAGVQVKVEPYHFIIGDDSVSDFERTYTSGAHSNPYVIDCLVPTQWGGEWGQVSWGYDDKYFQPLSGIGYLVGSGIWSGATETGSEEWFFTGLSSVGYEKVKTFDTYFTGTI